MNRLSGSEIGNILNKNHLQGGISLRDFMLYNGNDFDNAVYFLEEGAKICVGTTNNQGHQVYYKFEHTTTRNYLGFLINRHDIEATELTEEEALKEAENGLLVEHGTGLVMVGATERYENNMFGEYYAGVAMTTSDRPEGSLVSGTNIMRVGGNAFKGLDRYENSYFIQKQQEENMEDSVALEAIESAQ